MLGFNSIMNYALPRSYGLERDLLYFIFTKFEQYSGLIELDTLILDNTIPNRGEHEYKTSIQNLYQ